MRLILGHDDLVAQWASRRLGTIIVPPYVCFGVLDDLDEMCGAIVFNSYTGPNIEMTIYGPGCINRRFIRAALDYAFNQAKALRLSVHTARRNKPMYRILRRFGFHYEGILKRFYGPTRHDDAYSFVLFPEDAVRWMRTKTYANP